MYKCTSTRDRGTLYQLRNAINRRNVVEKPVRAVSACEEFFVLVAEAHIVTAAMAAFNMASTDEAPSSLQFFLAGCEKLSASERKKTLLNAAMALVNKHVNVCYLAADKKKKREKAKNLDRVKEYASDVMSFGLLLMEFNDAIREGDGDRICRCWKFFMPIFKASKRKNYAIESFILLAQLNFLLTPRMAAQLKWSRTINIHGKPGKNIPCDLHMEHLNRLCKSSIAGLGSNVSDKAVLRIGKCLGEISKITESFDSENGVPPDSGEHARKSEQQDFDKIVGHLKEMEVFANISRRKHAAFPKFRANPTCALGQKKLKKWMKKQMHKLL